ncbi:MAG TPA: hypothetical protein VGM03_09205 [Phycisphaerae bacterium]|jgi:hypothetical protein
MPRALAQRTEKSVEACPRCGKRPVKLVDGRCAACGHVARDQPVTSEDTTLYAQRQTGGRGGWWAMAIWIFTAGTARIKYLALIRASRASRRFVRVAALWIGLCGASFAATHVGWRLVTDVPAAAVMGQHVRPVGDGWHLVSSRPPAPEVDVQHAEPTHLWWNALSSLIAGGVGLVVALALVWVFVGLLRRFTERALRPPHRGQQRLSAAIHYDFAWAAWLLPVALVLALLPLGYVRQVQRAAPYPPLDALYAIAAVIAAIALLMGWFTLIRIGATAPAASRARVVTLFALWTPLLAAALLGGAGYGSWLLLNVLLRARNLQW